MFHYFLPESRVPADHPLRRVKKLANRALSAISPDLDALYSSVGRPSIPPERLLKGQLLIALYPIRSDRQVCEQRMGDQALWTASRTSDQGGPASQRRIGA